MIKYEEKCFSEIAGFFERVEHFAFNVFESAKKILRISSDSSKEEEPKKVIVLLCIYLTSFYLIFFFQCEYYTCIFNYSNTVCLSCYSTLATHNKMKLKYLPNEFLEYNNKDFFSLIFTYKRIFYYYCLYNKNQKNVSLLQVCNLHIN